MCNAVNELSEFLLFLMNESNLLYNLGLNVSDLLTLVSKIEFEVKQNFRKKPLIL